MTTEELDLLEKKIKERLLTDPKYTKENFNNDLNTLKLLREMQEEEMKERLEIKFYLEEVHKKYKDKNLTDKQIYEKLDVVDKKWTIFKKHLHPWEWVPARYDICEYCGKISSSSLGIGYVIKFDLVPTCSKCFEEKYIGSTS